MFVLMGERVPHHIISCALSLSSPRLLPVMMMMMINSPLLSLHCEKRADVHQTKISFRSFFSFHFLREIEERKESVGRVIRTAVGGRELHVPQI